MATPTTQPATISGVQAFKGEGIGPAKGFWAEAWGQILHRPRAVFGLAWISVIAFFAIGAPLIASGHPLLMWELENGQRGQLSSPLLESLSATDWLLAAGTIVACLALIVPGPARRSQRLGMILAGAAQAAIIVVLAKLVDGYFSNRDAPDWARRIEQARGFVPGACAIVAGVVGAAFWFIPSVISPACRAVLVGLVSAGAGVVLALTWHTPPGTFNYSERIQRGEVEAVFTLVPWSPAERPSDRNARNVPPGTSADQPLARVLTSGMASTTPLDAGAMARVLSRVEGLPLRPEARAGVRSAVEALAVGGAAPLPADVQRAARDALAGSGRPYMVGTDNNGQDVLSQMLHACRLAISIGLVSTGIATLIGVTIGSLMGYFGGVMDLLLYRVVEIFMAVPLLFILIVAAGVLPRNTYVMMAVIGCFTWTTAARFTRAEFYKLRNQDFVQSAKAVGLPLRSILFRHMLPNGVTPVLVEASFAIAFAIILEATLSFLGLGPEGQPSWGRLLANAIGEVGDFVWWLAVFPGLAIFLAALSYNLIGESLRDAIDPKLKKARV